MFARDVALVNGRCVSEGSGLMKGADALHKVLSCTQIPLASVPFAMLSGKMRLSSHTMFSFELIRVSRRNRRLEGAGLVEGVEGRKRGRVKDTL